MTPEALLLIVFRCRKAVEEKPKTYQQQLTVFLTNQHC